MVFMIAITITITSCFVFCLILWLSKSLDVFIKAEETIKKNMWEEEKMLDTYSTRSTHTASHSEKCYE